MLSRLQKQFPLPGLKNFLEVAQCFYIDIMVRNKWYIPTYKDYIYIFVLIFKMSQHRAWYLSYRIDPLGREGLVNHLLACPVWPTDCYIERKLLTCGNLFRYADKHFNIRRHVDGFCNYVFGLAFIFELIMLKKTKMCEKCVKIVICLFNLFNLVKIWSHVLMLLSLFNWNLLTFCLNFLLLPIYSRPDFLYHNLCVFA